MWPESQAKRIPFVSGLIYNNPMKLVRCNMCMEEFPDWIIMCPMCNTEDYLMDLSVVPDTITSNNERI